MSPEQIKAAAARNIAHRRKMIESLGGVARESKALAESFKGAAKSAKDLKSSAETARKFSWVPGFFPTPRQLVKRMVELAEIHPGDTVLEPSAGKGDIANALANAGAIVECIEINSALANELQEQGLDVRNDDFMTKIGNCEFDAVVMNPPFERKQDERHIRHAWTFLRPGGRLVAIACAPTGDRLRDWVEGHGGVVESLPDGTFRLSERSTGVRTVLIVMRKESE